MAVNNPQSADRSYKFNYELLGIRFHRYLYHEGDSIEFIETEIPETGQRKDIVVKVDDDIIQLTDFLSKGLYEDKLFSLCDYHEHTRYDPQYEGYEVQSGVVSIANPNHGINKMKIDKNITFGVETIFIQQKDGRIVLNNLVYKAITYEKLSDTEAIDLIILPDMDIDIPIKQLMKFICFLIGISNIPDDNFKKKIIQCEIKVLARFFKDDELREMIDLLKTFTRHPEVERVIEKYGEGFDTIYFDGRADGFDEGINKGIDDGKLQVARNLLRDGFDEEVVSRNTGIFIDKIKNIKREL